MRVSGRNRPHLRSQAKYPPLGEALFYGFLLVGLAKLLIQGG